MTEEAKTEDKYFQIEFQYSGEGFIRLRAPDKETAVKTAHEIIAERGGTLDAVLEVTEVPSLYPEGTEPPRLN